MRTALIVLGMHRSGTSALTGVLARMGCDLPKTEMPQNDSNAKGFYESHEAYRVNNALLESAGSTWQDWQPLSPSWAKSTRAEEFQEEITQVFANEFGTSRLFVFKDPRVCRLLPYWEKPIKAAGCDIVVVHTHRNPLEVAQSMRDRKQLPIASGLMVWLRYVLDAEAASRAYPRSFTSYARLMQNWQLEINQIEKDLKVVFPRRSLQSANEIEDFLTPALKHFNHTPEDVDTGNTVNDWVRTAYAILEDWAANGERASDRKTLDQINTLFSNSAENFGPMMHRMQHEVPVATTREITKLQEKLATLVEQEPTPKKTDVDTPKLNEQISALKTAAAASSQKQAALSEERDTLAAERDGQTEQITKLADERARAIKARDAYLAERDTLATERGAQAEQIAALEHMIQTQARNLETYQTQQAQLVQQAQARQEELTQMVHMTTSLTDQQSIMRDTLNEWKALHAERTTILKEDLASSRETAAQAQSDLHTQEITQGQLARKIQTLEDEQAALKASALTQSGTLSTTQSALRQRQLETEQAYEIIEQLKADIERMAQEQSNQSSVPTETVTTLENMLADRSRDVARYEQENVDLGTQLKSRYQEIAELTLLTANITQERDRLKSEGDRMHLDTSRNLKKQAQQINIQQAEIKATMDSLHDAKVARDYFKTTLASLQKSSSWRLTGPLRRFTRLFRR